MKIFRTQKKVNYRQKRNSNLLLRNNSLMSLMKNSKAKINNKIPKIIWRKNWINNKMSKIQKVQKLVQRIDQSNN